MQVLEDFDIPEELRDMFISIPADKFRVDISSTDLRKSFGMWISYSWLHILSTNDRVNAKENNHIPLYVELIIIYVCT